MPVCEAVPAGVSTNGILGMTLETLDISAGYYRTSNHSHEVLECYREEACSGGQDADRYCAQGYAGPCKFFFHTYML